MIRGIQKYRSIYDPPQTNILQQISRSRICIFHSRLISTTAILAEDHQDDNLKYAKSIKLLPGPRRFPIIGNLIQMIKSGGIMPLPVAMAKWQKQYGDIFSIKLGSEEMICLAHPDKVEELFRKEGKFPRREKTIHAWTEYHKKRDMPEGIFVLEGEEWARHRSALNQKLLKPKEVENYAPDFNSVITDLLKKLISIRNDKNEIENIDNELFKWSLESVGTVLFEKRLGCFSRRPIENYLKFIAAVQRLFTVVLEVFFEPPVLQKYFTSQSKKDLFACLETIYDVGEKEIENKLKDYQTHLKAGELNEESLKQFIPYLYFVKEMSVKDIKSDIVSIMMAAVDTTSTAMLWILINLTANPMVQDALHEEVVNFFEPERHLTPNMLQEMHYLRAVVKESMRLSPVIPFNARWFTEDVVIDGYRIPKKTLVTALNDCISHDSRFFEDPNEFKPERWLKRGKIKKGEKTIHPYSALPFGFGTRMCIGRRLAEMKLHLLLAKISRQFIVECEPNFVPNPSGMLSKPERCPKFKFHQR